MMSYNTSERYTFTLTRGWPKNHPFLVLNDRYSAIVIIEIQPKKLGFIWKNALVVVIKY
jgi:alpha-D-ribose 1-methylphosphonate 5-triphosphate synthase subunit PhnI